MPVHESKGVIITLEAGSAGRAVAQLGEPRVLDGGEGAANGEDVIAAKKHRVLCGGTRRRTNSSGTCENSATSIPQMYLPPSVSIPASATSMARSASWHMAQFAKAPPPELVLANIA
jgi:hypothetical protein